PEVLAHHSTAAGEYEPALRHWMRAGIRASLHSANQEAVSHLQYALKLLRSLPDTAQRAQQELQLLLALGIPLSQLQGYRSPEVKRTYTRARELFHGVGDALPDLEVPAWGLFAYYFARAEYRLSHELAEQLVDLGSRKHHRVLLVLGYRMMAADFFAWGQQERAREHVERALACSDFTLEEHRLLAERHWMNPTAVALIHAALIHAVLGQPERALEYRREALALAARIGHANTRAYTLLYAALSCQVQGDARGTLALAEECHALASEHWLRLFIEWSGLLRAWAVARLGQPAKGLEQMREWLGRWRMTGLRAGMPHNLGMLAQVHLWLGQPREALLAVQEGMRWEEAVGECSYAAELHRIGAEARRALGDEAAAHASLLEAVRIARAQGAGTFERHALLALETPAGPEPGAEIPGRG
ncbi:MAG TPA: protein kinase, partial [Archangium sp.]|nr:protein kinase [Archangium sp.]